MPCRRVRDEPKVLEGVTSQPIFLTILAAEAVLQAAIVQLGGAAFGTQPLPPAMWALSLGLGASTMLVRAVLAAVPSEAPLKGSG